MTLLFFPQWQGVGFETKLAPAAQKIREYMANRLMTPLSTWTEVVLDDSLTLEKAHDVIAHRAITSQLTQAKVLLSEQAAQTVFTLGGDCGIEVVPVSHLNRVYDGNFAVIWVDAHADLNTPQTSPSASFHGMPLRALLGEGDSAIIELVEKPLTPKQVFMVGVREFDAPEQEYVEANHIPVFHPQNDAQAFESLIKAIREVGFKQVYLHLDLDALEPSEFPHTPFATPKGLHVADVLNLAVALSDSFDVVGMSITEYDSETGEGLETIAPILLTFTQLAYAKTL